MGESGDNKVMQPRDERSNPVASDEQTRIAAAWYGDGSTGGRADWRGAQDPVGEMLGDRYVVEREIGSGAFSITYRGRDERLGRTIAIKVLRPNYALDATYVQRFEREARTAASISQGNVVDVYDFGRHRDLLYIVMQYVEGEDLKHLIVRDGPLPPRQAVEISRQVLAGLAAIHHAGIIHRDIKPQNVMIGNDGIARVTDFGVAHVTIDAGLTTAGTTVGTASYMAPEQAQAEALTEATDLYAVGVVLYEILTGRLPFEAPTAIALMLAHIRDQPVPPSRRAPDQPIPASLDAVVMRALAKTPEDRYGDSAAMARALSTALQTPIAAAAATQALPAARPAVAGEAMPTTAPPATRRLGVMPIGLLVLVLIGGALAGATLIFADGNDPNTNVPAVTDSTETPTVAVTETATVDVTATSSAQAAIAATEEAERQAAIPTETPTEQELTETSTEPAPTDTPAPTETPLPTETPAPTETPEPTAPATLEPTATEPAVEEETSAQIVPIGSTEESDDESSGGVSGNQLVENQSQSTEPAAAGSQTYTGEIGAEDWNGAYYREVGNLQPWAGLYSQATEYSTASIVFDLPGEPTGDTFDLTVEGMTSENIADIPLAIEVNGVEVDRFNTPFPSWNGEEGDQPWTVATFTLPTESLQAGRNQITIVNLIETGEFGVPPYVLLADATLSIDVSAASGVTNSDQYVSGSGAEDEAAVSDGLIERTTEEDDSGQGRSLGRSGGDDDDDEEDDDEDD